ncbi:MAG: AmmeMemoRadiSam system radical SAM enzyme [Deltaproteobacteria bacterium]|nr:AmmeMemoRadiSam system radical SAM enzyme [Deltaproteobacteria bacterium]MBW2017532.1 AmmeMemoRadiSam system radical SAM enzyme [Deltaproteobacteria bacterium]MBW2128054.1 AmmeMemoRadiSam system radical SAM enzyme [Deltaproteobacteria bacterium]MBW2304074.1 AmmeMemoRadiSam system radical SAM enzyme [Deltaproteobacteria bacterium]
MKEAYLYEKLDNGKVKCLLCNHRCLIRDGGKGICNVRENRGGTLVSLVYGKVVARHVDPIEKKPLFHFLPGTPSYSMATVGCNFRCSFCQNADISQMPVDQGRIWGEDMTPGRIVEEAERSRSATIAYTYTEPTVYYELAVDTARLATERGIRNVFVSNGYMTVECLQDIHPHLHGANVDLKSFSDKFYRDQCGARLDPVLRSLETMHKQGIWIEVTTLLIPGLNDSKEEVREIAGFLARLDQNIPWHISRFHPTYRLLDVPATPPDVIRRAREIGFEAGLRYVYTGNLPGDEGEKTFCHQCGHLLIDRYGFTVGTFRIEDGHCPECHAEIPGVWK